jgi:hypothetical protein
LFVKALFVKALEAMRFIPHQEGPGLGTGFLPGSPSQCAGRRRRAAIAQLLTTGALFTGVVVALSAVLTNIAGASPAPPAHTGNGAAIAIFVMGIAAAFGGLAAISFHRWHARRS